MTKPSRLPSYPLRVATDGAHVYWGEGLKTTGVLAKADAGTGLNVTTLATGQPAPISLAVAGNYVYWGTGATGGGPLMKGPK